MFSVADATETANKHRMLVGMGYLTNVALIVLAWAITGGRQIDLRIGTQFTYFGGPLPLDI
jgi:hypothetical protein